MYKTVCEFIYETYHPQQWHSVISFNSAFIGENAEQFTQKWNAVVCGGFVKVENEINEYRSQLHKLHEEYDAVADDRTFFQKLTNNKNTANWKRKHEIEIEIDGIYNKLSYLGKSRKNESELIKDKAHKFLEANGFLIASHCVDRGTHYEIWVKEN